MASDLILYQIGHTPIHLHQKSLVNDYSIDSRGKAIDMLGQMNYLVKDVPHLYKPRKIKVSGYLVANRYQQPNEQVNSLKQLVGVTVPLFAYIDPNLYQLANHNTYCCECEGCSDECELIFIQAIGQIKKITESRIRKPREPQELKFEIELYTFWKSVDNIQWSFGGASGYYDKTDVVKTVDLTNITDLKHPLPTCGSLASCVRNCHRFRYMQVEDCLWRFDTTMLDHIVDPSYVMTNNDEFCFHTKVGQHDSFTAADGSNRVYMDTDIWNAPPLSYYIIDDFSDTGTITINVKDNDGGLNENERETIIDIDATNTLLTTAGLTTLGDTLVDEQIVIGDFKVSSDGVVIRNAAIIRDGDLITEVQPVVTFEGYFPAMIYPKYFASVKIDNATMEAVHLFRRI